MHCNGVDRRIVVYDAFEKLRRCAATIPARMKAINCGFKVGFRQR